MVPSTEQTAPIEPPAGYLDGVIDNRLCGWAIDTAKLGTPALVRVVTDVGQETTIRADSFREDVLTAGISDGFVGFSLPLRQMAGADSVRAFVGPRELSNSPYPLADHATAVEGAIEGIRGGWFQGWAYHPLRPSQRLTVTFVPDLGPRLTVQADIYRGDLRQSGHGDGYAGFEFPLWRLIGAGLVRVYAGASSRELPGSPVSLAQLTEADAILGRVEGILNGRIYGWAFNPLRPQESLTVEVVEGERGIEARADIYRADLARAGMGDGHAGFSIPVPDIGQKGPVYVQVEGRELPWSGRAAAGLRRTIGPLSMHLDPTDQGLPVTGWIIDMSDPLWRGDVALRSGKQLLARERATLWRPDGPHPIGDALHGFRLDRPAAPNGEGLELIELGRDIVLADLSAP